MKFDNSNLIKIIPVAFILIISIIAVSTNYWSTTSVVDDDTSVVNIDIGLWKVCNTTGDLIECKDTDNIGYDLGSNAKYEFKNLEAIKILSISSIVLILISIVVLFLIPNNKEYLVIFLVLAGLFFIISAILLKTEPLFKNALLINSMKGYSLKSGYSWYLELIGGIIAILLGIATQFNILN